MLKGVQWVRQQGLRLGGDRLKVEKREVREGLDVLHSQSYTTLYLALFIFQEIGSLGLPQQRNLPRRRRHRDPCISIGCSASDPRNLGRNPSFPCVSEILHHIICHGCHPTTGPTDAEPSRHARPVTNSWTSSKRKMLARSRRCVTYRRRRSFL